MRKAGRTEDLKCTLSAKSKFKKQLYCWTMELQKETERHMKSKQTGGTHSRRMREIADVNMHEGK